MPDPQTLAAYLASMGAPAYQPNPQPGLADVLARVFGDVQIPTGREVPSFKRHLAYAMRGLGQGAQLRVSSAERVRALKNAENLKATEQYYAGKGKQFFEPTPEQRAAAAGGEAYARESGTLKAQRENPKPADASGLIRVPWTGEMVARTSELGQHVAGGGTKEQWSGRSGIRPPSAGFMGSFGGQFDPVAVYQGMKSGVLAPDASGYSRGQWGMVATAAAKDPDKSFNPMKAGLDYKATQTFWGTRNRQQQLSIRQNLERLPPSLDLVLEYSDKLKPLVARHGVKLLNRAAMTAAMNGLYGPDAQDAAQNLATQINDTTFELQQVYGNGYSPTDQALKLAMENLSKDWNEHVLRSSVDLAKRNVAIRANSVEHTVASTPSNPSGVAEPQVDWRFDPATGKMEKVR